MTEKDIPLLETPENAAFSDISDPLNATTASGVAEDSTHSYSVHGRLKLVPVKEEPCDSAASTESEPSSGSIKCTYCGKAFSKRYYLVRHMCVHTGEKPYQCHVCKKRFTQKGTLSQHMRIHTNYRPYKCHLCPKGFIQQGTLTQHLHSHTGEKPYKCHVCSMSFAWRRSLAKHLKLHGVAAAT